MESLTRILPVFPLPLVQFPGAITPLHIFENRYRKLLADVLGTDKMFGVVYRQENAGEIEPALGSFGCSVEIIAAQQLPDGRSNILCAGDQRFRTLRYVEGEPYFQAEIEFFRDLPGPDCTEQARHVSALFTRVLSAGRKLKDMSSREETPELPEDPEALSFLVCAYLEIPNEVRLEMLELRDTAERLRQAQELLEQAAVEFEKKATLAELSRKNGHGGKFELPGQAE